MPIEDEVFDFVAEQRGMKRDKLKVSDRLLVDLGMDGDDASEFFEAFEKKFEVDLTYLQEHHLSSSVVDSCCPRDSHNGGHNVCSRFHQQQARTGESDIQTDLYRRSDRLGPAEVIYCSLTDGIRSRASIGGVAQKRDLLNPPFVVEAHISLRSIIGVRGPPHGPDADGHL
jgi:acyl carrier protein